MSQSDVVITGVRAIDPQINLDAHVDVRIESGRIASIGPSGTCGADLRRIDGRGRWLLPGLVEIHAHFREPGYEHKEDIASGLRAASAGGYVCVCAMPNTRPPNDHPSITAAMISRAKECTGPRLMPIAAITKGLEGHALCDLKALSHAGAVAFSDDGRCVMSGHIMRSAMLVARDIDRPIVQHAEDHTITQGAVMHEGATSRTLRLRGWPREAEDSIVARDLVLAKATGARYHLAHASTQGSVDLIRRAKNEALAVTAEVAPHHLLLTDASLVDLNPSFKVNPPLRELGDTHALLAALADGTIDCIATDHAPHADHEKQQGIEGAPCGMIGLELCLPLIMQLVVDGLLPLGRAIDALSSAPAHILGVAPPTLQAGQLADLCLFDPNALWSVDRSSILSKSCNTPWLGKQLRGRVDLTMANGNIVFDRQPRGCSCAH